MEYLFRGKRVDSGEWVEGSLWKDKNLRYIRIEGEFGYSDYEVFPETVGMWTGLLDKNGDKIFEGDEEIREIKARRGEDMICPIMSRPTVMNDTDKAFVDCRYEFCAWWDKDNKQCCVKTSTTHQLISVQY